MLCNYEFSRSGLVGLHLFYRIFPCAVSYANLTILMHLFCVSVTNLHRSPGIASRAVEATILFIPDVIAGWELVSSPSFTMMDRLTKELEHAKYSGVADPTSIRGYEARLLISSSYSSGTHGN